MGATLPFAAWVAVSLALVGVAATSGPGGAVPDLGFRQVGHWVYSGTLGRVFHVNGASKAVDASGKVEGGRLAGGIAPVTLASGAPRGNSAFKRSA